MKIATLSHFGHKGFMSGMKSRQLANPALRFGMVPIARLVAFQNTPQGVKFPMFTEQMLAAESIWMDVPDSHFCIIPRRAE